MLLHAGSVRHTPLLRRARRGERGRCLASVASKQEHAAHVEERGREIERLASLASRLDRAASLPAKVRRRRL